MGPANDINRLLLNETFDLDLFVQLSPDLICIAGYDGFFKKINPSVSNTLGYTQEELLSKPINDFVYIEDKVATSESRESVKRSNPLINFENRYVTKSGEILWLSWTSIGIEAYTTLHDLRSPVNSLLSVFSLLEDKKVDNGEVVELLDILKQSTEHLRDTLNKNLDTLIQKKSLNIALDKISLTESFNTVQRSLRSLIIDTKTEIRLDFTKADVIQFNKTYLDSIFLNLISNSIKYAKPNTYPKIYLHTEKVNGAVVLVIKDEGLGFDMEKVKDRIFGFSQTFHDHKDSKGIGLYLVYNHLKSLGGHIGIDSRMNEGATFTITFKE